MILRSDPFLLRFPQGFQSPPVYEQHIEGFPDSFGSFGEC